MEISQRVEGSQATVSPSGDLIAYIADAKLRVCRTQLPEHSTPTRARLPAAKERLGLRWSSNGRVAALSHNAVEVVDVESGWRGSVDNGGRGFGCFSHAEFVGDNLLTTWEFGRASVWDLESGKSVELGDLKTTCDGAAWAQRPVVEGSARSVALLIRPGAEDHLSTYLPATGKTTTAVKLGTVDAQSMSWSPDGRWLAVLDTPTAGTSVHFYTPDAHLYRSYPTPPSAEASGLGVKAVTWSGDSRTVALSRYDGKVVLLNARTFSPLAMIEHTTTIDQHSLPIEEQAPIWQEAVAASGERSYTIATQPVSPPLSRSKTSTEPSELGVAEARFSCDGSYLATRDERMLSTVWIWNMATLAAHAVISQHSNVRRVHWHPTRPDLVMLDCGESIAYICNVNSLESPPLPLHVSMPGTPALSWLHTASHAKLAIIAATKSAFRILYPEGRDLQAENLQQQQTEQIAGSEQYEDGASEDSLMDVLSGRKPPPPRDSYTEMDDLEGDVTVGLDDTFREKRKPVAKEVEVDPLDDSQIF